MAQTPSTYQNSPVSATRYFAARYSGVVFATGDTVTAVCKSWTGANGGGSLIQVTTLQVWVNDVTTSTDKGTNSGNFNTVSANGSSITNGDTVRPSGQFTGAQSVGSLEMYMTYTTSAAFIPTQPTFSPSSGGVGTVVTLTGTRFTNATFVNLNGVSCPTFTVNSDTSISVTIPAGATSGTFVVGNPAGSSPASAATFFVATGYVFRSGLWTVGPLLVNRSSVQTNAQGVFVYRSTVWTPGS